MLHLKCFSAASVSQPINNKSRPHHTFFDTIRTLQKRPILLNKPASGGVCPFQCQSPNFWPSNSPAGHLLGGPAFTVQFHYSSNRRKRKKEKFGKSRLGSLSSQKKSCGLRLTSRLPFCYLASVPRGDRGLEESGVERYHTQFCLPTIYPTLSPNCGREAVID